MPPPSSAPVRVDVLDDRFRALVRPDAVLRHLADGCTWAEGPVYLAAAGALLWSDVRSDRLMRFDEVTGAVSVEEQPANF
jgi:gluconolactonase